MKSLYLCYGALILVLQASWAEAPSQPSVAYSPEWVHQQVDRYFEAKAACEREGKVLVGTAAGNTLTTKCVSADGPAYKAAQGWAERFNAESLKKAHAACATEGKTPEGAAVKPVIFYHCVAPSNDSTKPAIDVVPKGQDTYWIHVGGERYLDEADKRSRQRAREYCAQMRKPVVVVTDGSWDEGYGLTLTFTCVAPQ